MSDRSAEGSGVRYTQDKEKKPYFEINLRGVPLAAQLWAVRTLKEVLKREPKNKVDDTTAKSNG